MSTQALVPVSEISGAMQQGGMGFDALSDMKPAPFELVQNTSRSAPQNKFGQFRDKESNLYFPEMEIVPLAFFPTRVFFAEGDFDSDPLCRSNDGIVPADNVILQQAPKCGEFIDGRWKALCPNASWANFDKATGKGKPTCQEKIRLLFLQRETGLPGIISFGGMSLTPLKGFKTALLKYYALSKAASDKARAAGDKTARPLNIFDFKAIMKSVTIRGKKGSFYVVQFDEVAAMREEDRGKFGPVYENLVMKRNQAVEAAATASEVEEQLQDA